MRAKWHTSYTVIRKSLISHYLNVASNLASRLSKDKQQADEDHNEGEAHQRHRHPVLSTGQQQ